MNNLSRSGVFAASALGLLLVLPIGASASDYGETYVSTTGAKSEQVTVDYSDLDLSKRAGIESLHGRISRAARRVCGPSDWRQAGSTRIASANRACYDNAVSEGLKQIDSALVAATGK
jgi:UrcA family protein